MNENQMKAAKHNWLRRCVMGARWAVFRAASSETCSPEARKLAFEIDQNLIELIQLLEKREDQK